MTIFDKTIINLLDKAKNGDKRCEEEIFRILRQRFVMLAKYRIGEKDSEDIAQEACVTVLEKYKSFDRESNFEAWAYQILRNKIGNYMKTTNFRQKLVTNNLEISNISNEVTTEHGVVIKLNLQDCLSKLDAVNSRYSEILRMVFEGYKTDEICSKMKIKPGNLYLILHQSRKMLRECLNKKKTI